VHQDEAEMCDKLDKRIEYFSRLRSSMPEQVSSRQRVVATSTQPPRIRAAEQESPSEPHPLLKTPPTTSSQPEENHTQRVFQYFCDSVAPTRAKCATELNLLPGEVKRAIEILKKNGQMKYENSQWQVNYPKI